MKKFFGFNKLLASHRSSFVVGTCFCDDLSILFG